MQRLDGCIYQPAPGFETDLQKELERSGTKVEPYGPYYFVSGPRRRTHWHKNVWLEPFTTPFSSISDAAKQLKSLSGLWVSQPFDSFRKSALIQENLPRIPTKPKAFPFSLPQTGPGVWTILDDSTLLASASTSNPFLGGEANFLENSVDPPSSAYLKLYEALTLYGKIPQKDDFCIDAGSSPGGWTWVLAQTGTNVLSIDRAPIHESLRTKPNVEYRQGNAFNVRPNDFKSVDWLFSDVICYPQKLFDWVNLWLEASSVRNFIVTVKMQGEPDWETIDRFAAIPHSKLVHLWHNKHELTWMYSPVDRSFSPSN